MGETTPPTTTEAYLRQAQKERDEWKARAAQQQRRAEEAERSRDAAEERAALLEQRIADGMFGLMGLGKPKETP